MAPDFLFTFDIAEVRSRQCPSFEDGKLESHTLNAYFCPALIISCDKLHQKREDEDFYKAKCTQHTSPLLMNLQLTFVEYQPSLEAAVHPHRLVK